MVAAVDVRAVVRFVEQSAVDAGIVYATDAAVSERVIVIATIPASLHDPIVYPAAVVAEAGQEGHDFMKYLQSDEASALFEDAGFAVLH